MSDGIQGIARVASAVLLLALSIAGACVDGVFVVGGFELTRGFACWGGESEGGVACAQGAVCFVGLFFPALCFWSRSNFNLWNPYVVIFTFGTSSGAVRACSIRLRGFLLSKYCVCFSAIQSPLDE